MDEATRARVSTEMFGLFARIVHRTEQDASAILRREGLNAAQFQLLRAVAQSPGTTQVQMVQHRGVTPGGVSQLVGKVEALGLLRREAEGAANRLFLTPAGASLVERLVPAQDVFFAQRFAVLSEPDLMRLRDLADRAFQGLPEPT